MKKELISVVIVNWNGRRWLKDCLDSLHSQNYDNYEIIFVDNNSSDNSVEFVSKKYPKIRIIQNKENVGFAKGNNQGIEKAKGDYVLLLNNDTWVEKDFLEKLIKSFEVIPNLGCVQPRIVLMKDQENLDVCGAFWTSSSFLYYYGLAKNKNLDKYNKIMPVFSIKGAAMMIPKKVINKIGLFDDDFWCYYEETDFCHRLWLSGYECWYYPKTTCYHAVGGISTSFHYSYIQFHGYKNKLSSFLKNFEFPTLFKVLPIYFFWQFTLSLIWLAQGKLGSFSSIFKATWWNIVHIKSTVKKRKLVQLSRQIKDRDLFLSIKKKPRPEYYYHLINGSLKNYEDAIL